MRDEGGLQLHAGAGGFLANFAIVATAFVMAAIAAPGLGQSPDQSLAQSTTAAPIQRTHPARKPFRAARLTFLAGSVSIEQANSKTQDEAVPNMPLVEGTALSTGDDGQAEVEFEDGSLIRITPNSGISLVNLSADADGNYKTRVAVLGGLVYAELRAGTKYQYSLDAAGDVVTPAENSTVRLNLDEPPAQISVLQGSVHVTSVNGPSTIDAQAGETARSDAQEQGAPFVVKDEIASETWDQWNEDRDQIAASEAGTQTAARDQFAGEQGYGWSDLDANGSWYNVPGQGQVWQPDEAGNSGDDASNLAVGQDLGQEADQSFDPYGYGSWVWTPAGYSWASGYNWGWLPYRCGQWAYFGGFGWGWQPSLSCGAFGFAGYGFGGYGYGINVGRAPGFWKHPRRPIPGPGPVHPIVHGRAGPAPFAVARTYDGGRLVRVKTLDGKSIDPLPPIAGFSALRGGAAVGSALKRDYPLTAGTREPVFGIAPTHTASLAPVNGRMAWQAGSGYGSESRQNALGRSNMMPGAPNYGSQPARSAPAPRTQPAPSPRPSAPPAASHSAQAAAPSPKK